MLRFAVRRLGAALATTLAVVVIVFALAHLAPGEPFLDPGGRGRADPERRALLRARYGLDQPLPAQFTRYLARLVRGDLGESFTQQRPVATLLRERLPPTALLALTAMLLGASAGIGIALAQAARAGGRADRLLGALTLTGYSLPAFWLGLVLLVVFAQLLRVLPAGGMTDPIVHARLGILGRALDLLRHLVLPATTLAVAVAAVFARFGRGAIVDALAEEWTRTARAKGLARAAVLRQALRAAAGPLLVLAGTTLPALLAGAVVVENVFAWPGMGRLMADAIAARDYNLIGGAALVAGAAVALGNLAADLAARAVDPRLTP